jgi:hypothetical protein
MWPVSYQGKYEINSSQNLLFNKAADMRSGAVIYVLSSIKTGLGIQN